MEFLKTKVLGATNPPTRAVGIEACASVVKIFPHMAKSLENVKDQLKTQVEAEIEKIVLPETTLQIRTTGGAPAQPASGKRTTVEAPRRSISSLVQSSVIQQLDDASWKAKVEALEQMQKDLTNVRDRFATCTKSITLFHRCHVKLTLLSMICLLA